MSVVSPILGNQGFVGISNLAASIPSATIIDAKIGNLSTQLVNTNFQIIVPPGSTNVTLRSITGSSSSTFDSLTDGNVQFLNAQPGQPTALTVAGGVLAIPPGATIVAAFALDKFMSGATALNIGTCPITGSAPILSTNIFNNASRGRVQKGVLVTSQQPPSASSALGGQGIPLYYANNSITIPTTGSTGISVSPIGDMTTTDGLTVTLYYYI